MITTIKKPDTRRKRQDAVRTLADLQERCLVDDETGCWNWGGAFSNAASYSPTPITSIFKTVDAKRTSPMSAARAAWILAGKPLTANQVVWRCRCVNHACVNPAHCRAGTRLQMTEQLKASGRHRGCPARRAINLRSTIKMATPPDLVRRIEAMFAEGMLQKDGGAATGLRSETLRSIRLGLHVNSSRRQQVVPQASVFAMGIALASARGNA
jgi:hypothetical protein